MPLIYDKTLTEIEKMIQNDLGVKQNKKVELGEVFTPFHLIVEMLDKLPQHLWKNPNLKWLDPGCGIGNFSMVVFQLLDAGLKNWETNASKRRQHIIENMIYMVEITESNVKEVRKIFGEKANISMCDVLEKETWQKEFGVSHFDVIYGNPPYNKNGMRGKGRSDPGLSVIWNKIVDMSLDLLNKDKYLLFFTPNSWTELKSPLSKKMLENQILYIKNFDVVHAYKLFDKKAGSLPLCYYLIQKSSTHNMTKIHDIVFDDFVEFNIYKHRFIPNRNIQLIKRVLSKNNNSLADYYSFTPAKVKKDETSYAKSYSQNHCFPLLNYVHKKMYISYSHTASMIQNGRPKLIFPNYSMGYPILDSEGILDVGGRSSYVLYLPSNNIEHLKKIQAFFMTNLALTLINSLKTAQKFLSTRTFSLIPDLSKISLKLEDINDEYLEKYYGFSKKEKEGLQIQRSKGEGNLSETMKKDILTFSLKDELTVEQIDHIKKSTKNSKTNKNNYTRKHKNMDIFID